MNTTLSLNPAFCLLLLRQRAATWSELVRIIFMDLVQRKKLSISADASTDPANPPSAPLTVALGDDGRDGKSQPHERFLLEFFDEQPDARLPLKSFLKMALQKMPWSTTIQNLIMAQPTVAPHFQRAWWQRLFGGFSLSSTGLGLRATIAAEVQAANAKLLADIALAPAQTATWVKSLGAHALLLPDMSTTRISITLDQLQDALKQVDEEASERNNRDIDIDSFDLDLAFVCTLSNHVYDAGHHGHGHDSGCGADGGDGGCSSSDSGCGGSGCSGCGGGCGGGD